MGLNILLVTYGELEILDVLFKLLIESGLEVASLLFKVLIHRNRAFISKLLIGLYILLRITLVLLYSQEVLPELHSKLVRDTVSDKVPYVNELPTLFLLPLANELRREALLLLFSLWDKASCCGWTFTDATFISGAQYFGGVRES